MEVNGVCVTGMSPNEIVKLLGNENSENGTVTFKLEPAEMPAVIAWNESRHVRALVILLLKFNNFILYVFMVDN